MFWTRDISFHIYLLQSQMSVHLSISLESKPRPIGPKKGGPGVKNQKFKSDPNFLKLTYITEIHNLRLARPFWFWSRPYFQKYGHFNLKIAHILETKLLHYPLAKIQQLGRKRVAAIFNRIQTLNYPSPPHTTTTTTIQSK